MTRIEHLKVIRFTKDRVPNPYPGGELPWQVHQGVRNSIVQACRTHGPVGPMGEVRIDQAIDDPFQHSFKAPGFWQPGDADPAYYIVPDQYNNERYIYAELYGDDPFSPAWVADIVGVLGGHPGWGLGISNIPNSYVLLFGDRLMVKGKKFGWWPNSAKVVENVRLLLRGTKPANLASPN